MDKLDRAWRNKLLMGDDDAAIQLASAALRPVWGFCCQRLGGDLDRTREIVKAALVMAVQRIDQFDPEGGDISAWLEGLAEEEVRRSGGGDSHATATMGEGRTLLEPVPEQRFLYQIQGDLVEAARASKSTPPKSLNKTTKSGRSPIACPNCGHPYKVKSSRIGRKVRCSDCKADFVCAVLEEGGDEHVGEDHGEVWFVYVAPETFRPYTVAQIRELISSGELSHDVQVRRNSSDHWMPALGLLRRGDSEVPPIVWATSTPLEPPRAPPVARRPQIESLGRFQVKQRIGGGSFGDVYRAYDPVLDREVALKVANESAMKNELSRDLIAAEPKAAAKLRHPNIVAVHDAGSDGGNFFVALELISGETLKQRLASGSLDQAEAVRIVTDLARALDYAHRTGVVHRDVKPANIMLDDQGQVLVTDFGLAQIEHAISHQREDEGIVGTLGYMPPEQIAREWGEIGPASDQYSLGVVLYELLCGQPPFSGPPEVLAANTLYAEPPPLRQIEESIPVALQKICQTAMSKRIADRYQSAGEMADDLTRFAEGRETTAHPWNLGSRIYHWCAASPFLASAVAVSILLLLLLTVTLGVTARTERRLRELAQEAQKETADTVGELGVALKEREDALKELGVALAEKEEQRRIADLANQETQRAQAFSLLRQAQFWCESGDLPQGLAYLVESLKYAEDAAHDLVPAIQQNLAVWWQHLHPLRAVVLPTNDRAPDAKILSHVAAVSPQGVAVTVVQFEGTVDAKLTFWDVENGSVPVMLSAMSVEPVQAICFNSSGDRMGTIHRQADGFKAFVWQRKGDRFLRNPEPEFSEKRRLECLAFATDDKSLLVGGGTKIEGFVLGRTERKFRHTVRKVAVARQGDREFLVVALGTEDYCELSVYSGADIDAPWTRILPTVHDLMVSSDGRHIVTAAGERFDGEVQRWNVKTGAKIGPRLRHLSEVYSVDMVGEFVLTASRDGYVQVWHAETGRMLGHRLMHQAAVRSVCGIRRKNGADTLWRFLSASDDGVLRMWSAGAGVTAQSVRTSAGIVDGAYNQRNGRLALVNPYSQEVLSIPATSMGSGNGVQNDGDRVNIQDDAPQDDAPTAIGWIGPQRALVGFHSGRVASVDMESGLISYAAERHTSSVRHVRIDTVHQKLTAVTCGADGELLFWNQLDSKPNKWRRIRQGFPVETVALDPLQAVFVAGGKSSNLFIFDHDGEPHPWSFDGEKLEQLELPDDLLDVTFSPEGHFLAVGHASGVQVWRRGEGEMAASWTLQSRFELEHGVTQLEILPKDELLVTGQVNGAVRFWHLITGESIGPPIQQASAITTLSIDPEMRNLFVATVNGQVSQWPLPTQSDYPYSDFRQKLSSEAGVVFEQGVLQRPTPNEWVALAKEDLRSPLVPPHSNAVVRAIPTGEPFLDDPLYDLIRQHLTNRPVFHTPSQDTLAKYIPSDACGVLGLDVRQLQTAPLSLRILAASLPQYSVVIGHESARWTATWLKESGFNPLRDMDYLVLTIGSLSAGFVFPPAVLTAHGRFDAQRTLAALQSPGMKPELDKFGLSYEILSLGDDVLFVRFEVADQPLSTLYVAIVDNSALLVSRRRSEIENVLNRSKAAPAAPATRRLLAPVDREQTLWLAVDLYRLDPHGLLGIVLPRDDLRDGDSLSGGVQLFADLKAKFDLHLENRDQILIVQPSTIPQEGLNRIVPEGIELVIDMEQPKKCGVRLHVPSLHVLKAIEGKKFWAGQDAPRRIQVDPPAEKVAGNPPARETRGDSNMLSDLVEMVRTGKPVPHLLPKDRLERYIPADTCAVVALDIKQLQLAPLALKVLASNVHRYLAVADSEWREWAAIWLRKSGFNPLLDIDHIVLTHGSIKSDTNPTLDDESTATPIMLTVHGRFDADRIMAALRSSELRPAIDSLFKSHKVVDQGMITLTPKRMDSRIYVSIVDGQTMLISLSRDLVENVAKSATRPSAKSDMLTRLLQAADKSHSVWFIADVHGLLAEYGILRTKPHDYVLGGATLFSHLDVEVETNWELLSSLLGNETRLPEGWRLKVNREPKHNEIRLRREGMLKEAAKLTTTLVSIHIPGADLSWMQKLREGFSIMSRPPNLGSVPGGAISDEAVLGAAIVLWKIVETLTGIGGP